MENSLISLAIGPWQLILIFIVLISLFMPIAALISILKNDFKNNDKIVWVLVALFLPVFGSLLYFIIGRPKRLKQVSLEVKEY